MEVTCRQCGERQARDGLDALPGGFGFSCERCATPNVLAPIAVATAPDPEAPSEEVGRTCPKCGHHQPAEFEACHRCGLAFAYYESGRVQFTDPLADHPRAEQLRGRWAAIAERLADTAAHHAFIELCAAQQALEFAGDCYRRLTVGPSGAHPALQGYRERVIRAAMAQVGALERRVNERQTEVRRLVVLTLAALVVLGFAIGYWLLMRYQTIRQSNG